MSLNAHRVLAGDADSPGYLGALNLLERQQATLRKAREEIRAALREGLRSWADLIGRQELIESAYVGESPKLRPKFRMQGSFAYHTCNHPAQVPPQEIDLDDGLFLPISFLRTNGTLNPILMSRGFFLAIERILQPLCDHNKWRLVKDKNSCVRVVLSSEMHVDIALYAIPDDKFVTLVEKQVLSKSETVRDEARGNIMEALELDDSIYRNLQDDEIMLAHREEGWKPSDPRKLEDWFQSAIVTYGQQVRRLSRYLKGWRDHSWDSCRLASIALMAAVVESYDTKAVFGAETRDDKALLAVAQRLPQILSVAINNPVVEGQRLDEGWTEQERESFKAAAEDLTRRLHDAIENSNNKPEVAIAHLVAAFGDRIPRDTSLLLAEGPPETLETKSLAGPLTGLAEAERLSRAEAAAREVEARGPQAKPWVEKAQG